MLEYKKVKKSVAILHSAKCDRCHKEIDVTEGRLSDGAQFRHSFTWNNKDWPCGDMQATVCESCIIDIFHFAEFTPDPC